MSVDAIYYRLLDNYYNITHIYEKWPFILTSWCEATDVWCDWCLHRWTLPHMWIYRVVAWRSSIIAKYGHDFGGLHWLAKLHFRAQLCRAFCPFIALPALTTQSAHSAVFARSGQFSFRQDGTWFGSYPSKPAQADLSRIRPESLLILTKPPCAAVPTAVPVQWHWLLRNVAQCSSI